jgi:hypothetical protein
MKKLRDLNKRKGNMSMSKSESEKPFPGRVGPMARQKKVNIYT